jgi:hypothetical protein
MAIEEIAIADGERVFILSCRCGHRSGLLTNASAHAAGWRLHGDDHLCPACVASWQDRRRRRRGRPPRGEPRPAGRLGDWRR